MVVRGISGEDNTIDRCWIDVITLEEILDRLDTQIRSPLGGVLQDTAFAYPYTGHDPLIIRIDHLLEVGISQLIFGEITSYSRNSCVDDTHSFYF